MAQVALNRIFVGSTPLEQRKFLTAVLKHLRPAHPTIILPAVGHFSLVKCAVEAGYERPQIFTSDVSLFSSLLGYLFAGKPVESLPFKVADQYLKEYVDCTDDTQRVAYLLWLMKYAQMAKMPHFRLLSQELFYNRKKYQNDLIGQVVKLREYFGGIQYGIFDLRSELKENESDQVIVFNPPLYKNGYKKMYDFEGYLTWDAEVEEFDYAKEYVPLYEQSKKLSFPVIWYRSGDVEGFSKEDVLFAREYDIGRQDYWLITKPEKMAGFPLMKHVTSFTRNSLRPYGLPVFQGPITAESRIRFVQVPKEVGLYYRDLFAHKLGNTGAEHYLLMLIDEKVFATLGLMTSKLFRLQQECVFETFGFSSPVKGMPRANRLLMYAITCREFAEWVKGSLSKVNRIYTLNALRTTCLSKYRKVKLNNGILDLIGREMLKNGMYKLLYETKWHERSFADCITLYLEDERIAALAKD